MKIEVSIYESHLIFLALAKAADHPDLGDQMGELMTKLNEQAK
tara:strand:+ start:380 stop:508 length:129 start_codon:yes stop_codon:yes gene_type:complete